MKPSGIFLFLVAIGILSVLLAWITPKEGFQITDSFHLRFATFEKDSSEINGSRIKDIHAYLKELENESPAQRDSLQRLEIARRKKLSLIQWPANNHASIFALFDALEKMNSNSSKVRIMHFGDSQIEGDRITGIIRKELQNAYGGIGAGLLPPVQGVESASMIQSHSDNWSRYTLYGRQDKAIKHYRYGPLMSFGMFTNPSDTLFGEEKSAWIAFSQSGMTFPKTRAYSEVYAYYGFAPDSFTANLYANGELLYSQTYPPTNSYETLKWEIAQAPNQLKVEFISRKSPEFYAFSFEGKSGVTVDNIGLRGSSGTVFTKTNNYQLRKFMESQPIELLILQFGGNTVPYIESQKKAIAYGNWFKSQINYLREVNPKAAIIVIGPSDMSTKINGEFTTYPFLEDVRDVLKKAALETGCGYWDLFEVMGGKNSMISWVEANPALAGKDYVHFTNIGMRKVSELFMHAFWHEKSLWEKSKPIEKSISASTDSVN